MNRIDRIILNILLILPALHSLLATQGQKSWFVPRQVKMKLTILYHYFHPDDVVSARLYSDLAVGLQKRGWDVEALPCNRGCRNSATFKTSPVFAATSP